MKKQTINKCEELKLIHAWKDIAWKDITLNGLFPINFIIEKQKQYKHEQCQNCGLIRILKYKEWFEYKQGEIPYTHSFNGE